MRRAHLIIGGVVVVVLGLIATWFLLTYERVEEEVDLGFQGQARTNRFFAAELLLEELGVPTESRYGLGAMPGTDHVIVLLAPDAEAREPLADRLLEWVQQGGHLVVAAPAPPAPDLDADHGDPDEDHRADDDADEDVDEDADDDAPPGPSAQGAPDPLLEAAGLVVAPAGDKQAATPGQLGLRPSGQSQGSSASSEPVPSEEEPPEEPPSPVASAPKPPPGVREVLAVVGLETTDEVLAKMDGSRILARPIVVEDDQGLGYQVLEPVGHVARQQVGEGLVTAVVDPFFLENGAIGEHDHAQLLADLVDDGESLPVGAILVLRGESNSIVALVGRHGWMVLIALAILIAAWVWSASRRFGPALPDPPRVRRSLLEHVEAAGAFLWRHGYHIELLESTREAVRRRLAARLPGAATLEGGDLAEAVSQETGMRASRVHDAFYGASGPKDRKHFTESMRELQRLWRER